MAVKKKGGKKFLEVDFSGVESGGKALPDGSYTAEIAEVTEEESSEGNAYLKWKFRITEGDCKGSVVYDNTSLQPQALWRLKGLLECLGEEVPDSVLKIDINDYVEGTLDIVVVNETYEGRDRPKVAEYGAAGALTGGKKKSSKSKPKADEDDDAEEADDDNDEEEEEKPAAKRKASKKSEPEFEEGQRVKFTDDEDNVQKGKIVSIEGDNATVDVKGEEWEIAVSDLTAL